MWSCISDWACSCFQWRLKLHKYSSKYWQAELRPSGLLTAVQWESTQALDLELKVTATVPDIQKQSVSSHMWTVKNTVGQLLIAFTLCSNSTFKKGKHTQYSHQIRNKRLRHFIQGLVSIIVISVFFLLFRQKSCLKQPKKHCVFIYFVYNKCFNC